jgi:hypothetical protein
MMVDGETNILYSYSDGFLAQARNSLRFYFPCQPPSIGMPFIDVDNLSPSLLFRLHH